jgi:hypothetical protein
MPPQQLGGGYRMPGAPQASDAETASACPPLLGSFLFIAVF